jgi:hypothetical protein
MMRTAINPGSIALSPSHAARGFSAEGFPVFLFVATSKVTIWLSLRSFIPARSTALICTKTSSAASLRTERERQGDRQSGDIPNGQEHGQAEGECDGDGRPHRGLTPARAARPKPRYRSKPGRPDKARKSAPTWSSISLNSGSIFSSRRVEGGGERPLHSVVPELLRQNSGLTARVDELVAQNKALLVRIAEAAKFPANCRVRVGAAWCGGSI